ncbi:FAD-binding protein [Anaerotruncus rubiinfantis]|uniref:FAD-binding protein n=1 Tax=Anaerotruncus rubiinfantis TaxID=1720200 RepID=UPI0034A177D3
MYDLAIVGLGPAGSTLARLLGPRMRVAAIDRKDSPENGFRKPCGGLLAPDAQKALACLGLTLPRELIVDPQIFSVRTIDLDTGVTRYYQRFYVNLDRHRFDLWLRGLIPPQADLFTNAACRAVEKIPGGWRVRFWRDGREQTIEAARLVGADGANSLVREVLYPHKKLRSYVSIQQWFADTHTTPFYSCVFDSENTDCYSWALSKDGSLIFGGAYPAKGCRERFERQKRKLESVGIHLGEPKRTEACRVLRPASPGQFCCGRDNAFLIGEAAGFISPSSLEGISSAILSAVMLARVLAAPQGDPNGRYRAATLRLRAKLSLKLLKCPFMYSPPLRRLVMKSGLNSIEVMDG